METIISKNITDIRNDFPILKRKVNGQDLVYLDNAASTQMPQKVIDAFNNYHKNHHSNVHRGVHTLSQEATDMYEATRNKVKAFIGANNIKEIVFTTGTTDSINLVASSFANGIISKGDVILASNMEHHANIVPWYMLAKSKGAIFKSIPINNDGEIDMEAFKSMLNDNVKIVAVNHVSNALGTINPVEIITRLSHQVGAYVVVDGAQAVSHMPVNVTQIGCDFYAFSAHKLYGPTGFGILYGKQQLLESMPPYRGGGDMIKSVSFDHIIFNDIPYRFEAGTPPIAQGIMLGAAIDYINEIGFETIQQLETDLLNYATDRLSSINGLRIIGTSKSKASVISFVMDGIHPHDIGTILDQYGVAVRTGHHCAQPVMERFGVPATTRASFSYYNTKSEVDALYNALLRVQEVFA